MRKEVNVTHEVVACDVCGRTILKGEHAEPYLAQDGTRRFVCELCQRRAEGAGWIREAAHADTPAFPPGTEPRPSLLDRVRSRWRENGPGARIRRGAADEGYVDGHAGSEPPSHDVPVYEAGAEAQAFPEGEAQEHQVATASSSTEEPAYVESERLGEPPPTELAIDTEPATHVEAGATDLRDLAEVAPEEARGTRRDQPERRRIRDPRHVRAVPTNAEAKVDRALEVFNDTEDRRTVGGLMRTLGEPWVTAVPALESTSEVIVVVAWELSWYQYRVDLGDSDHPVMLTDKGKELRELDVNLRDWNAVADADGALAIGVPRDA